MECNLVSVSVHVKHVECNLFSVLYLSAKDVTCNLFSVFVPVGKGPVGKTRGV